MLRHAIIFALTVTVASPARAQTANDPSGHWTGTVQIPDHALNVEFDLARNASGQLSGTFTNPAEQLTGWPLLRAAIDGSTVTMEIQGGSGTVVFKGTLAADGKSIAGDATNREGSAPFSVTRTGEARIEPAPRSAPIGKDLEGVWTGTLDVGTKVVHLELKLANQPDGMATGTLRSIDEGLELPVAIAQKDASVIVTLKMIASSFEGTLNGAGTAIAGVYTQRGVGRPLTFTRGAHQ